MEAAPTRSNEDAALSALRALEILDSEPEAEFDALARTAAAVCGVPVSLISLIDEGRQWFKANVGLSGVAQTSREQAFCAHAVLSDDLFEVEDATRDPRFLDNPLVTGQPGIRFYAGAPLTLANGERIGTLCVIDQKPGHLTTLQRGVLRDLSLVAARAMEGRLAIRRAREATIEAARAALVLKHTADAVIGVTPLGRIDRWNKSAESMFGYAPAEILGHPLQRLHTPERADALHARALRVFAGQADLNYETTHVHRDGTVLDVAITLVPEFDVDGKVSHVTKFVRDITRFKNTETALRVTQEFLERSGWIAGIGGWQLDLQSRNLLWSAQTCRIHGLAPGYLPSLDEALNFYRPHCRALIKGALRAAIARGTSFDLELEIERRDGSTRWVRVFAKADLVDGRAVRLVGAFHDIDERHRMTLELAEKHELLRVTLQSIGEAVITTDPAAMVTWLNPVAERLTGWLSTEALGRPLTQVFHIVNEQTRAITENPVATCLAQGKIAGLSSHPLLISKDGSEFGIEDSASPIRNAEGKMLGMVLVFHDVSEQRRLSREMTYRATHDTLTGLVNRAEFEERLLRLLRKSHEDQSEHAILYIDLDQFKLVNDACGHAVGDQLLQQVARQLCKVTRTRDTVARLGGDEFGIILEHCKVSQAQTVAQKICDQMEDFRFLHEDRRLRVGASIGLVPVDCRWANTAAIQQAADSACYAAKEAGRNRMHTWFDTDAAIRARKFETQWAARIGSALDENRFVLFAQRIEALKDGPAGLHAEVLVRMLDEDNSLILPGAFLPAAERFSLVSRLDRWVLRRVIAWMRDQPSLEHIECLSVNLSGQSVGDHAFQAWASKVLGEAGDRVRSRLCLEITETVAVTNLADAAIFIQLLRSTGVRVALDDFGAGASSFAYLKSLPVDYLKIDGQFIRGLVANPLNDAAVRCFAEVARLVGVKTVAEFVDTPEVLARLHDIGIDLAQGFLLHRPEPIDRLSARMLMATG